MKFSVQRQTVPILLLKPNRPIIPLLFERIVFPISVE